MERKALYFFLISVITASSASATDITTGTIKASSTGPADENLNFKPDYVEFFAQQKTESTGIEQASQNAGCPQNVNGWSEGAVIFGDSGIQKRVSIAMSRNSDSTNNHRVASSTQDVIKMPYAGQNGQNCGKLEIDVTSLNQNGFEYDIQSRYQFNEIVRYKAYQFPDNMEFDAGLIKITGEGTKPVTTKDVDGNSFEPANLHFRAGQRISGKNINRDFTSNDPDSDNTLGRSKGYATISSNGQINQQAIGTASSSDSTNAHKSLATDDYVINTAYVGQNGNLISPSGDVSRLRAKVSSTSGTGFSLNIEEKWGETDEVILYRAWGKSFYQYDVGYEVVSSDGTKSIQTEFDKDNDGNLENFQPEAIDIYSEQQITQIDKTVTTPENSGCDNAGGWSYGYYLSREGNNGQFALATGRTSDSQNSHRYGYTNNKALLNQYVSQDGNNCGVLEGEVTSTDSQGFNINFQSDQSFQQNYGEELFYYRALRFPLQPPQVENIKFNDNPSDHSFDVNATVREGSNDISSCEMEAREQRPDNAGIETYGTNEIEIRGNETWSWCLTEITYDDNNLWKDHHDNLDELPQLKVDVTAEDVDGQRDSKTSNAHRFPNHKPSVQSFSFKSYSNRHAFNVTAELQNTDAESGEEISSCQTEFSGEDGNTLSAKPELRDENPADNNIECFYSNINSSYSEYDVLEQIQATTTVTDHHATAPEGAKSGSGTATNQIPNRPPTVTSHEPLNDELLDQGKVRLNVTLSDPEGDRPLTVTFRNHTDDQKIGTNTTQPDKDYDSLSAEWLKREIGTEQRWYVELTDGYDTNSAPTDYWHFTKLPGAGFRVGIDITTRYSSIIVPKNTTRAFTFKMDNEAARNKEINLELRNVDAEFTDEQTTPSQKSVIIPEDSTREFTAEVKPQKTGRSTLTVQATNQQLGLVTTENITIYGVKDPAQGANTETVPGITNIGFLILMLSSLLAVAAVRNQGLRKQQNSCSK